MGVQTPISKNVRENRGFTTEMNCGYNLVCKILLVALPMLMLASLVRTRLNKWCIHFLTKGNTTSEILHTNWYPQFLPNNVFSK